MFFTYNMIRPTGKQTKKKKTPHSNFHLRFDGPLGKGKGNKKDKLRAGFGGGGGETTGVVGGGGPVLTELRGTPRTLFFRLRRIGSVSCSPLEKGGARGCEKGTWRFKGVHRGRVGPPHHWPRGGAKFSGRW